MRAAPGSSHCCHRLEREYSKPETIGRKLDAEKQKAFIEAYENLLNSLGPEETVWFVNARASNPCGASCRLLGAGERRSGH